MQRVKRSFNRSRGYASLAGICAALLGLSSAARADDPPTRVGRIALLQGTVSFRPAPQEEWGIAVLNYPVAQSTAIWVNEDSRAELEIGEARIRMDEGTELDIKELDDQAVILTVPQGRIDVSLHGAHADEHYEIDTSRGSITLTDGVYRVMAGGKQDGTAFATLTGSAQLTSANLAMTIAAGQEAVSDLLDPPSYTVADARPDEFDSWNTQRDSKVFGQPAPSYVPPLPGAQALNEYGTWRDVPDYGHVWMPADVAADWTPYSTGHWSWVAPWGWTWIDDAPWGFAPYHYGRWAQIDGAWAWVPVDPGVAVGVPYVPAYAPALVSFVGDPGVFVGFGAPCVGWVPLGPGEFWNPWYGVSFEYFTRINIGNVNRHRFAEVNATNFRTFSQNRTLINQHHLVVVPQASFAHGGSVSQAALHGRAGTPNQPIHEASYSPGTHILPTPDPAVKSTGGLRPATARPPSAGPAHGAAGMIPARQPGHPATGRPYGMPQGRPQPRAYPQPQGRAEAPHAAGQARPAGGSGGRPESTH